MDDYSATYTLSIQNLSLPEFPAGGFAGGSACAQNQKSGDLVGLEV